MNYAFALFGAILCGFICFSGILWSASVVYRRARRYKFDPHTMEMNRLHVTVAEAKSQWQAIKWVGLPSLLAYGLAMGAFVILPSLRTWLVISGALYLLILVRRVAGFIAVRNMATLRGKPPSYTLGSDLATYFAEVWLPHPCEWDIPRWLCWIGPVISVLLWPLTLIVSTTAHLKRMAGDDYAWPGWRTYA